MFYLPRKSLWPRSPFPLLRAQKSTSAVPNPLRATYLRGGTSKGIFLNRADLPEDKAEWDRIFLGIMGSPDSQYGRQLNGMGGGVSSLSKICVVGAPSGERKAEGLDVEYTFVQVGIRDDAIDYSGNCGNLSSMIGVFAMDEGICAVDAVDKLADVPTATVRSFNTNTQKRIDTTFPVSLDGKRPSPLLDLEQESIAGVTGKASQIILDFVSPSGARTGALLPSGQPTDLLKLGNELAVPGSTEGVDIRASLVDATNPTVFITSEDLRMLSFVPPDRPLDYANSELELVVEAIRGHGAERMGLDPAAQAQPKIAVLSPPEADEPDVDIVVHAFSMGVLHKAVPMTVGLCLGVAANVEGTLAWSIVNRRRSSQSSHATDGMIRIRHPGGVVAVGAAFENGEVTSARVARTGRRLMKGIVWW
ncbi:hypothetical protein AcW1_008021 [Taiwanofungus camphoratus]|nr:hypothetical protein AcW1_008021 [Antrodia cinnamomea]KAI0955732.1 hypothetical protein AcV7_006313 [Antrodia cinnamomea]